MDKSISQWITTYNWYRNLTILLIEQMPETLYAESIAVRSLPLRTQFIDMGDVQLKIIGMVTNLDLKQNIARPSEHTATPAEIIAYLHECSRVAEDALRIVEKTDITINWHDRMQFTFHEALSFLLAHEAMHHGELLSFVFVKDIQMPDVFKNTWGFEPR